VETDLITTSIRTDTSLGHTLTHLAGRTLIGGASGLVAGLLYAALLDSQRMSPMMSPTDLPGDTFIHLLLSIIVGISYALVVGDRVTTPGGGLVSGILAGLIWWGVGPLTLFPLLHGARPDWGIAAARDAFPLLVGLAVTFGALMGWLNWLIIRIAAYATPFTVIRARLLDTLQAAISGGLAGMIGGWVFGKWMEQAGLFPLIAGLVAADDSAMGRSVHFVISIVIGITYGVLFQRDVRSAGSSIAWGFAYGLIWWVIGALTILPFLLGDGVQWSRTAAQGSFASLIGHLLYGITLGLVYALISRFWRTLFIESDPLTRAAEGPGTRGLRGIGLGAAASIFGGLAFTLIMLATNALPTVASLIGMTSVFEGFLVHMVISILIGASFGLLYGRESASPVSALGWGLFYGIVWWVLGPLTIMPALLGAPFQWSLAAAAGAFPSLIGHLLYGAVLGLVYHRLLQRFAPPHSITSSDSDHTTTGLWAMIVLLVMILLLLSV